MGDGTVEVLVADDGRGIHVEDLRRKVIAAGLIDAGKALTMEPERLFEFLRTQRPDVVTMDIDMPGMGGFEATRRIMETEPLPVVIVSGQSLDEQRATFQAFEAGAVAVVSRPSAAEHNDFETSVNELINTVKAMAEVRVIRRWPRTEELKRGKKEALSPRRTSSPAVVAIGASTGGPTALKRILTGLPRDLPFPVVVVQHMSKGFMEGFVDWLGSVSEISVQIAVNGERMQAGRVDVAPEGHQMGVGKEGNVVLTAQGEGDESETICPSISWLFRSLADGYGSAVVGILLTGMGRDGADSMQLLGKRGAITIAQSAETCIVNGMPNEAIKLGAARYVLSPEEISQMLVELAERNP